MCVGYVWDMFGLSDKVKCSYVVFVLDLGKHAATVARNDSRLVLLVTALGDSFLMVESHCRVCQHAQLNTFMIDALKEPVLAPRGLNNF